MQDVLNKHLQTVSSHRCQKSEAGPITDASTSQCQLSKTILNLYFSNSSSINENNFKGYQAWKQYNILQGFFFFFSCFVFESRECLSSLSGDSIVLLNSHGVRGKKMSHTQGECIHKGFRSTYININLFNHT